MIVYPKKWTGQYEKYAFTKAHIDLIINKLLDVLEEIGINHLAYSGGIDSTIMLASLNEIYSEVHTYTISSRKDHLDIYFARKGSELYKTRHYEFIVEPNQSILDKFEGDNAVRQLFEHVSEFTNKIICCDGVDEFMCGYYDHQKNPRKYYEYYLSRLFPDHLDPLNTNSRNMEIYLPYLNKDLVSIYQIIPLCDKVDNSHRKKVMIDLAKYLEIPEEFINRNKYGFCDAFLDKNKDLSSKF